jgi:DNA-binding NarL/FixJ family response regulator
MFSRHKINYLGESGATEEASPITSNGSTVRERDSGGEPTSAKILVVIEDDPDVQFLIEAIFAMDPRFSVTNVAESAEEALEAPATSEPGIIVLDHGLAGPLPGLAAAPMLKELAPQAKIIMFTAHAALQARADKEPAIDAFLLKTESEKLLPLAQKLIGLSATPD